MFPGNYHEDNICIPENVTLVGVGGYEVTTISGRGSLSSASDSFGYFDSPNTRVIMSPNSTLQNFTIVCPSSSGSAGILYDHELPYTCGARFLKLIGSASTTEGYPSGSGIGPDGIRIKGGKMIGLEIRVGPGKFNSILDVSKGGGPNASSNNCSNSISANTSSAGVLAAQAIHIPPQPPEQ